MAILEPAELLPRIQHLQAWRKQLAVACDLSVPCEQRPRPTARGVHAEEIAYVTVTEFAPIGCFYPLPVSRARQPNWRVELIGQHLKVRPSKSCYDPFLRAAVCPRHPHRVPVLIISSPNLERKRDGLQAIHARDPPWDLVYPKLPDKEQRSKEGNNRHDQEHFNQRQRTPVSDGCQLHGFRWVDGSQSDSKYSIKSLSWSAVRCEVLPCWSRLFAVVSTSRIVPAEPSCRYGAVRQSSTSVGVSK